MAKKAAPNKTKKRQGKSSVRRYVLLLWSAVLLTIGAVFLVFMTASWGVFGALPDETRLEDPEKDLATQII